MTEREYGFRRQPQPLPNANISVPEVHAFMLAGLYQDNEGNCSISYDLDGFGAHAITVDCRATAAEVLAEFAALPGSQMTADTIEVEGGAWPHAIYIRFKGELAGQAIALPEFTASLTGVFRPEPVRWRASAFAWSRWVQS